MGLEVTGLEDMIAELQRLADPKVAIEATKRAVRAGAEVVHARVLENAPEREFEKTEKSKSLPKGALRAGLGVFDDDYKDGSVSSTVAFSHATAYVADLVETGHRLVRGGTSKSDGKGGYRGKGVQIAEVPAHPFFRPAVEGTEKEVAETIDAEFRKEIQAARKV